MFSVQKFEAICDRARAVLESPRTILWVIPLLVALKLLSASPADPDLFARIAMGRLTLSHAAVPLTDPFAFTTVLPVWIDHEWLSGVIFYLIASTAGDAGLIILKVILAVLAALCVIHASQRQSPLFNARLVWITLCLLHACSAWTSTVRCQAFTYLFIPLLYWAIIEYRKYGNAHLLFLSPLMAIGWVNIHGGYALGCCLIGLLCALEMIQGRLSIRLLAVAAAWALAPIFTPYGLTAFATFLLDSLSMVRPGILEWEPLHHDSTAFVLTLAISLPLLYGLVVKRRGADPFAVGAILFSAYCAFRHVRFLPFFMITVAIFGAPFVDCALTRLKEIRPSLFLATVRSGALTLSILTALASLQLASLLVSRATYTLTYSMFPVGAVEWLRDSGASGKLLVDFNLGSYALWRLYPNFKVSVDGRYEETYPQKTVLDNALAFNPSLPQGREALERINPTHILLTNSLEITDPEREFANGWKTVYKGQDATILSRDVGRTHTSISREIPNDMWQPRF